jgi:1,4-alpha-glucan branching enzyme
MIKKQYSQDKKTCKVTFSVPAEANAQSAQLCGDFTDWEKAPKKMTLYKDGSFKVTLTLKPKKRYQFRYLLDGERWENDWGADEYVPNEFGTEDSVLKT